MFSGLPRSTASPVELGRLFAFSAVSLLAAGGVGDVGLFVLELDLDRLNPPSERRCPVVEDDRIELPFAFVESMSAATFDDFE
jgi:hypothetical protein